jgi:hypothetical protein
VAAHPGQQRLVAVVGGRKLLTQQPALLVKCGCAVGVFVVVDAADDRGCFGCHAGIRSSVRADLIDRASRAGGAMVCDWLLVGEIAAAQGLSAATTDPDELEQSSLGNVDAGRTRSV